LSAGDGLWVVSTVREQKDLASLRIAVMVSPAEASRFAHGRTRGVHYTLLKPLRLSDLLSVVRAAYYQEVPYPLCPANDTTRTAHDTHRDTHTRV
jgi:DNA-binding response OmpR family regulator